MCHKILNNKATELSKNFKSVKFQWIPREENKEADYLSTLKIKK
jgi:ribonuclease HI